MVLVRVRVRVRVLGFGLALGLALTLTLTLTLTWPLVLSSRVRLIEAWLRQLAPEGCVTLPG